MRRKEATSLLTSDAYPTKYKFPALNVSYLSPIYVRIDQ